MICGGSLGHGAALFLKHCCVASQPSVNSSTHYSSAPLQVATLKQCHPPSQPYRQGDTADHDAAIFVGLCARAADERCHCIGEVYDECPGHRAELAVCGGRGQGCHGLGQ